ncbi:MAG: succinylglutamate desuccinylase/aspartoacylase family protein [Candidatus Hodarchaeota archaeon]
MPDTIKIGNVEANAGEKRFGSLKIGETPLRNIELPIGIINGAQDGPTVCIIAGEHPYEYAGIDGAIRVYRKLKPEEVNGALIVVPVVNVPGLEARSMYVNPLDNINLAFVYPGSPDDSISYRIAYTMLNDIVSKANYLLNLHGGDLPEIMAPFVIVGTYEDPKVDAVSEQMGRAFGLEYIVIGEEVRPTINCEAGKRGIPSIVSEVGSLGLFEEDDIRTQEVGVLNVLKYLKALEGEPIPCKTKQKIVRRGYMIRANRGGLFYPNVKAAVEVEKGEVLAEIRDLKGDLLEEVIASEAGWVTYMFMRHVVNTGDPLYSLGRLEK